MLAGKKIMILKRNLLLQYKNKNKNALALRLTGKKSKFFSLLVFVVSAFNR
jgi:hypothetical protein